MAEQQTVWQAQFHYVWRGRSDREWIARGWTIDFDASADVLIYAYLGCSESFLLFLHGCVSWKWWKRSPKSAWNIVMFPPTYIETGFLPKQATLPPWDAAWRIYRNLHSMALSMQTKQGGLNKHVPSLKTRSQKVKRYWSVCFWRKSVYRFAAEESMVRYLHIRHFARISLPFTACTRGWKKSVSKVVEHRIEFKYIMQKVLCKYFFLWVIFVIRMRPSVWKNWTNCFQWTSRKQFNIIYQPCLYLWCIGI